MTTTDETTTTVQAAELAFAITLPFSTFQTALRDVFTAGASTDKTLPVLTGVHAELAEDGTLTLAATDRYVLAWQGITRDAAKAAYAGRDDLAEPAGAGSVHLDVPTVKDLLAVKPQPGYAAYELVTLSVSASGALTVALPDTRVISYPAWQGSEFPRWRNLAEGFRPADQGDALPAVKYNPAFLARFAKIMGRRSTEGITITQVMSKNGLTGLPGNACGSCEGTGQTGTKPEYDWQRDTTRACSRCSGTGKLRPTASRIEAGDVTAIIMHIRLGD